MKLGVVFKPDFSLVSQFMGLLMGFIMRYVILLWDVQFTLW